MSVRVLLVDDHEYLRLGLHTALRKDSRVQVVGEAADGAEGVEMARQLRPDVVLMDIQMPVLNGIEATRQIVREMPDTKVIMLTMHKEENQELAALRVGALGYLHKDSEPADLLRAIHTVANGAAFLTPQSVHRVLSKLQSVENNVVSEELEPSISLSKREIELLGLLGRGLSNKEIAQQLSLSESRVRNQLSDLYQKIQVSGRAQAAVYAVEQRLF